MLRHHTYAALCDDVARFAGVFCAQTIALGDQVIVHMTMVPEAVIVGRDES